MLFIENWSPHYVVAETLAKFTVDSENNFTEGSLELSQSLSICKICVLYANGRRYYKTTTISIVLQKNSDNYTEFRIVLGS